MKIATLIALNQPADFGYKAVFDSREKLFAYMGIEHELVTVCYMVSKHIGYVKGLLPLLILGYSYQELADMETVVKKEEALLRVYHGDELLIETDYTKNYRYFGRGGDTIEISIPKMRLGSIYTYQGVDYNEMTLFNLYLSRNKFDVVFNDAFYLNTKKVELYCKNNNIEFVKVLHYVARNSMRPDQLKPYFSKDVHYATVETDSISYLEEFGYKPTYLPPSVFFDYKDRGYRKAKTFVFAGNMSPGKRLPMVVDAFRKRPDLQLDLYGEVKNIDKEYLENLPENITFRGYVNPVPYHKYDCYISTSDSEAYACALVEALADGCLAVVSDSAVAHQMHSEFSAVRLFDNLDNHLDIEGKGSGKEVYQKYGKEAMAKWYGDYLREITRS